MRSLMVVWGSQYWSLGNIQRYDFNRIDHIFTASSCASRKLMLDFLQKTVVAVDYHMSAPVPWSGATILCGPRMKLSGSASPDCVDV